MNQLFFPQAVNAFASDCFFNAESVHFTDTAKYVDPTSYADAMSPSDAKLWQEAFDKEMNGVVSRSVFSVVDRPADRNPLCTTMIYQYKIDRVAVCAFVEIGKRKVSISLNTRHSAPFSTVARIGHCMLWQQPIIGTCSVLISLRHLPMASWMFHCIAFRHLDSIVQRVPYLD